MDSTQNQKNAPNLSEGQSLPKSLVWRRNCPYLYSMLYVTELDWPSLTIDWVSSYETSNSDKDEQFIYQMLLGTHTSNNQDNYILMAKVRIPNQKLLREKFQNEKLSKQQTVRKNDELMGEKVIIQGYIPHEGEVNRVRHNPHCFSMIASRTPSGEVHIFNGKNNKKEKKAGPDIRLSGHDSDGYALEWNPNRQWHILSASYSGEIGLWDINKREQGKVVTPLCNFNSFHQIYVEDVSYNKFHDSIFISCDDEGKTAFWDIRSHGKAPNHHIQAHTTLQYGAQFSPSSEHIFATCGGDALVKVWDIRNLSSPLFCCEDIHKKEMTQVQWSQQNPNTLWTVSKSHASLWDISSQKCRFVHSGNREIQTTEQQQNHINQLAVNINQPDIVAVVDSNNEIQIFQPNDNCKVQH